MKDILIADKFKRNFLNGYSKTVGTGNDGKSDLQDWMFEDPTYLGFHIEFITDQIESPNSVACGLLLDRENPFSASDYLDRVGEAWRADLLEQFVNEFIALSKNCPWYFQSISGLNKVLNLDMKDSMRISADTKIDIETLESVNMKITRLFDMYRKATYDTVNMRDMLPDNMRKFNMRIHISEIRQFHTFIKEDKGSIKNNKPQSPLMQVYGGIQDIYNLSSDTKVGNLLNQGGEKLSSVKDDVGPLGNFLDQSQIGALQESANKIINLDNFVSVMTINLSHCVFDFENFNPHLETITNDTSEPNIQKFSIKPWKVSETNTYPLAKMVLRDVIANSHFPNKIITVPQVISISNGIPVFEEKQTSDLTKIDDIVKMIYPESIDSIDSEEIKNKEKNDLLKGGVFDKIRNLNSKYQGFKSELEKKLESLNINFNPLNVVESEIRNKTQQLLDGTILGNIYGIAPSNIIDSVKNSINSIKETKEKQDLKNIQLTNNNNEKISFDNMNLTENQNNISISGGGLQGNSSNYDISKNTLSSNQQSPLEYDNIDLSSQNNTSNIIDDTLEGNEPEKISFDNMNLNETINYLNPNDNIDLINNFSKFELSDISFDSNKNDFSSEKNIELSENSIESEIDNINFSNSLNNLKIEKNIQLLENSIESEIDNINFSNSLNNLKIEKNIQLLENSDELKIAKNIQLKESIQEKLSPVNLIEKINNIETNIQFANIFSSNNNIIDNKITNIKFKESINESEIQDIKFNEVNNNLLINKNINLKGTENDNMNISNIELKENKSNNDITNINLDSNINKNVIESNIGAESLSYNVDITKIELENKNQNSDSIKLNENIYGRE